MSDDFSKAPTSITEAKSARDENGGSIWTPRDVLISLLRDIDSGQENPDALVVVWRDHIKRRARWLRSSPDHDTSVGMMTDAVYSMCQASRKPE